MKKLVCLFIVLCSMHAAAQQRTKEDRKEEQDERRAAGKDRVDYAVFRRQILSITEFSDQRRKIAEWKAQGKGIAKIYAVVDSLNDNEDGKFLKGYIRLIMGGSVADVYELSFDRGLKRIVLVKPTGEQLEIEEPAKPERKRNTASPVKKKKTGDEDDEDETGDDDDEEKDRKPARKNQNEDDD